MWSWQAVLFLRASQVIMPFPASAGKYLPLSEENNDSSILSVRESTSGHEIEQTPVATGFQAYTCESKLDTLTKSMLKMLDPLARLSRSHGALLNSKEKDGLFQEGGLREFDPTERILSEETNLESRQLPYEYLFQNTEGCGWKVNKGVA